MMETRTPPAAESGAGAPEVIRDAAGRDYADLNRQVVEAAGDPKKEAEARRQQSEFWVEKLRLKPAYPDKETGEAKKGLYKKEAVPLQNFMSAREIKGYTFFFPDSKSKAVDDIELISEPLKKIIGENGNPREGWQKAFEENKDVILSEHKIHLQPKKEHIPTVIDRLVKLMEQRPEVTELVSGFKAKIGPSEIKKERLDGTTSIDQMPEIVIYPRVGAELLDNGKTRGRDSFEKVLAAVIDATKDMEGTANGKWPRGNAKVNELVYVAQSGGDLKGVLKQAGMIDRVFDRDASGNYSFAKGEKLPTPEELEAAKDALAARAAEIKEEKTAAEKAATDQGLARAWEGLNELWEKQERPAAPAEAPSTPAAKKPGFFGRLFGRGK